MLSLWHQGFQDWERLKNAKKNYFLSKGQNLRKKNLTAVILFAIAAAIELILGVLLLKGKITSNVVTFAAIFSGIVFGGIGVLALVNPHLFLSK
jgi:uncharacterized membrane protein YhaH (DUF805 family)